MGMLGGETIFTERERERERSIHRSQSRKGQKMTQIMYFDMKSRVENSREERREEKERKKKINIKRVLKGGFLIFRETGAVGLRLSLDPVKTSFSLASSPVVPPIHFIPSLMAASFYNPFFFLSSFVALESILSQQQSPPSPPFFSCKEFSFKPFFLGLFYGKCHWMGKVKGGGKVPLGLHCL